MGLDMYLYLRKQEYVSAYTAPEKREFELAYPGIIVRNFPETAEPMDEKADDDRSITCNILYKVGYWRKANHIHHWFVHNCAGDVDECQDIYVSLDDLEQLETLCAQVLSDHSKAPELLPTRSGFFFGGTEYDEYYFKDTEYTLKIVQQTIAFMTERDAEHDYDWDVLYRASW